MESEVQVIECSFVAPSAPTPNKGLWLSPLDLEAPNWHTPTVYLYRRPSSCDCDFFDVTRIKESMAKALVMFYPLAGRLGVDDNGRMEISCGGEGALFVVARAPHLSVDDIRNMKPSPQLRELLVPRIEPPSVVMVIQVTRLKCGGVALGSAIHHAATDALSALHFFQTWSAISRDGELAAVELPFHDRTLLRARSPPTVHAGALSKLYYPNATLLDPSGTGPIAAAVLAVSPDQVASLKQLCGGGASTFCAVSALVWQCRCAALARRLLPGSDSEETRLSFPVNIRRKMVPPLPARYFGNVRVRVFAAGAVQDIASEALAAVAGRVRGAIAGVDDELAHSAIDYYEMEASHDYGPQMDKGDLPETDLMIVSWLGMPAYDADFGWGKPLLMSRAECLRRGFVYLMSDADAVDSGGVRVLATMEAENAREMEQLLQAKLQAAAAAARA